MTHKVHPKIFRIKETADWNSRWLAKKDFAKFLREDFEIKKFLKKKLGLAGISRIEIERFPGKINIIVTCARPGLIIGRGGGGIEELKKELAQRIFLAGKKESREVRREVRIEIREVRDPWLQASLVSQWMAQQIEKRVFYKRVLKQALDRITAHKEVQGAKVEVAGRLGGAEIARRAWLKRGRLPRQTLRADIDYGASEAYCTYGVVGVKVWIYKGERF